MVRMRPASSCASTKANLTYNLRVVMMVAVARFLTRL